MKTSEFRIGNLVQDEKGIFYFVAGLNGSTDSRLTLAAYNKEVVKGWQDAEVNALPIKLTEEILLKCGFEIKPYSYTNPHFIKGGFGFDAITFEIKINGQHTNLKYLHQLQNIYFALTGEELIYDPK